MRWLHAIGHALALSGSMTWEILWALILGFGLSAIVQAVVRRSTIVRLLGDRRRRPLATGEMDMPRGAVGDDVDRVEASATGQRRRELARCRPLRVQHDRLHPWADARQQNVDVGNGGIDEQNFRNTGHGIILWRQVAWGSEAIRADVTNGRGGHQGRSNGKRPQMRLALGG